MLETSYRQVGPYQEQLTVFVHGQSEPAAKLTVSGAFLPAAKLSPAVIDFGVVHSGTPASRIVTVALDSRLLAPPHRLEVVANSPFITVDPVEDEASASGALNSTSISDGSKPKIVQREFKLTLSANASLGPFSCDASFSSNLPMASYLMHYGDSVTVKGVVAGEASAKPDHIDFGVIPVGKTAQWKVTIVLNSPLATPQIQLDCGMGNELVATIADDKGKLLATSDHAPQPVLSDKSLLSVTHLDLTVSFTPGKPAMGIFRQVFVTLGTQQIIIPISATAR